MTVHVKKQILLVTVLLICLIGIGFIYRLYINISRYNASSAEHCTTTELLGIRTKNSTCTFNFQNDISTDSRNVQSLKVSLRTASGQTSSVNLPQVNLTTDQKFLIPGGSLTVLGTRAVRVPVSASQKPSDTTADMTSAIDAVSPNSQNSVIPPVVTESMSSQNSAVTLDGVFIPIVQNTTASPTGGAAQTGGTWIGYYEENNGSYIPIDLSWLGYFQITNFEVVSYRPPEIRVTGIRNGEPLEVLLVLDSNNQIRTLFSTDSSVYSDNQQ